MIARPKLEREAAGGSYFASRPKGVKFVPSGCQLLDLALGGGWAQGRIANIVGDKSTGKTLIAIEAATNFSRLHPKGKIRYRESEAAFNKDYAEALGMPLNRVDFGGGQMETVEDFFIDLEKVLKKASGPELYILDSLDALSDRAEMERDLDQGSYGTGKSKQMSQLFRRLVRQMANTDLTLLIISQVRSKIGISFGRSTTRSGGRALDFYASQVLYLSQVGTLSKVVKGIKRPVGVRIRGKVDKNKVSLPFREAEFQVLFGYGMNDIEASIAWLKEIGALYAANIEDKEVKELNKLAVNGEMPQSQIDKIRETVERQWYAVEKTFLPTKAKYQ